MLAAHMATLQQSAACVNSKVAEVATAKVAEVAAAVTAATTAAMEKTWTTQEEVEGHLNWTHQHYHVPDDNPMTDADHDEGIRRGQCLRQTKANIDYDRDDTRLQGSTAEAIEIFEELGMMTEDSSSSEESGSDLETSSDDDSDDDMAEPAVRSAAATTFGVPGGEIARWPAGRPPLGHDWCPTKRCYGMRRSQGQQVLQFAPVAVAGGVGTVASAAAAETDEIAAVRVSAEAGAEAGAVQQRKLPLQ